MINILCDRALLGAYATNSRFISPAIIVQAARETLGPGVPRRRLNAVLALMFSAGIAAGIHFYSQNLPLGQQARLILAGQFSVPNTKPIESNPQPAAKLEPEPKVGPMAEPAVPKSEVKTFDDWLADPALSMNASMIQALKVWNKTAPAETQVDCNYMTTVGLHCLFDKANWKELLELNRPAILEFSLTAEEKRYGLLTGIANGQPIIRFSSDDQTFPLAEVLKFWDGYYLMLWKPSRPGMLEIAPQQLSTNVLWLRQQLAAAMGTAVSSSQPLVFDEPLKAQVINFQRQHHLTADGIAGARTLIQLDNVTGAGDSPHLKISE